MTLDSITLPGGINNARLEHCTIIQTLGCSKATQHSFGGWTERSNPNLPVRMFERTCEYCNITSYLEVLKPLSSIIKQEDLGK